MAWAWVVGLAILTYCQGLAGGLQGRHHSAFPTQAPRVKPQASSCGRSEASRVRGGAPGRGRGPGPSGEGGSFLAAPVPLAGLSWASGHASTFQNKEEKREACEARRAQIGLFCPGVAASLGDNGGEPGKRPAFEVRRSAGACEDLAGHRGAAEPLAGDPGLAVLAGAAQLSRPP